MPDPYVYTDPDRNTVTVRPGVRSTALLDVEDPAGVEGIRVHITAEEIHGLFAAMCEAADRARPIVLPRSSLLGEDATVMSYNGAQIVRDGQWVNVPAIRLRGNNAKAFAAYIAQLGEVAESEPDPAEVEAIAAAIAAPESHRGGDYSNSTPEQIARMLVRRFKFTERAS